MELISNDGSSLYIERASFGGQIVYEIPAKILPDAFSSYDPNTCIGYLYMTTDSLGFIPAPSHSCGGVLTLLKAQVSFNGFSAYAVTGMSQHIFEFDNKNGTGAEKNNLLGYLTWSSQGQSTIAIQPDNQIAADAEAWISLMFTDFNSADQHFAQLTSSLGVVPENTELQDAEAKGAVAQRQGNHEKAIQEYIKALDLLSGDGGMPESNAEASLRQKIITLVAQMSFKPRMPDEAMRHEANGREAAREAQDIDDLINNAIPELRQAVNIAPWWANGYWNLAVVLEKAKRYGQAAQNLHYYLLANPNAPDAASIKMKIYALQYQAQHQ